jgi:hypothetical protein
MSPQNNKRRQTAYHEAGHAVACFLLRRGFRYVSIEPDGDSLGRLLEACPTGSFRPDVDAGSRARAFAERLIMVRLAGDAAENLHRGKHSWCGARGDFHAVLDLTSYFCGDVEEEAAYARWLAIRIRNMLRSKPNWALVRATAAALLKRGHLSYREARKVMREAGCPRTETAAAGDGSGA